MTPEQIIADAVAAFWTQENPDVHPFWAEDGPALEAKAVYSWRSS